MKDNVVSDQSGDRKYFTVTPRLVWVLVDDPYEFTLWCVIKDIAGDAGECYLSTEDLATLAMMSAGKVKECRQKLLDKGLLSGMIKRDPGFPQPVWHMAVPNLWVRNVQWCERHPTIRERLLHKLEQRKSLHVVKAAEESEEPSPGEGGGSPHEGGGSPGETKKNHKEEPERKTITGETEISSTWNKLYASLQGEYFDDRRNRNGRVIWQEHLQEMCFMERSNGTVVIGVDDACSKLWLEERFGKTLENLFNGYPEFAGAVPRFEIK